MGALNATKGFGRLGGASAMVLVWSMLSGCGSQTSAFECADDTSCSGGVCEPTGFCSFPDGDCPSGRRYGEFAGSFSGQCAAPPVDAGSTTMDKSTGSVDTSGGGSVTTTTDPTPLPEQTTSGGGGSTSPAEDDDGAGCGECRPGESEEQECGNCGMRQRFCNASCAWEDWTGCADEGPCTPGDEDPEPCGDCGTQVRTCTDDCTWSEPGACTGQGVCSPGEVDDVGCGNCGTQVQTCTSECTWGPFGACEDEGVCTPGQTDSIACGCGNLGLQQRTCSDSCGWGLFGPCEGGILCGTQECCPGGYCAPSLDQCLLEQPK